MATFVVAHAGYDPGSLAIQAWAERARWNVLVSRQHRCVEVSDGARIDRARLEDALTRASRPVLAFYGHGSTQRLSGGRGNPVLDATNVSVLSGSICYMVACCSAAPKGLGEAAVAAGARAYFGYADLFGIFLFATASFEVPANAGLLALIAGTAHTCGDAATVVRDAYTAAIAYWETGAGASDPRSIHVAARLRRNRAAFVLRGDDTARL